MKELCGFKVGDKVIAHCSDWTDFNPMVIERIDDCKCGCGPVLYVVDNEGNKRNEIPEVFEHIPVFVTDAVVIHPICPHCGATQEEFEIHWLYNKEMLRCDECDQLFYLEFTSDTKTIQPQELMKEAKNLTTGPEDLTNKLSVAGPFPEDPEAEFVTCSMCGALQNDTYGREACAKDDPERSATYRCDNCHSNIHAKYREWRKEDFLLKR